MLSLSRPAPLSLTSTRNVAATQQGPRRSPQRVIRCQAEEPTTSGMPQEAPKADICRTCGVPRSEMSFGCDGSGRIQGGLGAVPGFRWWPIKAYRPCGKATSAGIRYQRKGQVLDDVLFGRK